MRSNRRLKAAHQAGRTLSQPWYYALDQWMLGARADEDAGEALLEQVRGTCCTGTPYGGGAGGVTREAG